ncbi:MAG: hypothetical protein ACO395_10725, partial [Pontimonas sp.]
MELHLDSDFSDDVQDGVYTFHLDSPITAVGVHRTIECTAFQTLNCVYNINEENNEFLGDLIEPGFYRNDELVVLMRQKLPAGVAVFFNTSSLRFTFQSDSAFELSGTLLSLLDVPSTAEELGTRWIIRSRNPVDLYKNAHSYHILTNLRLGNHSHRVGDSLFKLATIPIRHDFGSHEIYEPQRPHRHSLFEPSVKTLKLLVRDDAGRPIRSRFSITLKFDKDPTAPPPIQKLDDPVFKRGAWSFLEYAVVPEDVDQLLVHYLMNRPRSEATKQLVESYGYEPEDFPRETNL